MKWPRPLRLKQERPKIWADLVEIELTTGDLRGSEAKHIEFGALANCYPECQQSEISQLRWKVRQTRWTELGIEF
jgi:hypothetical protein